MRFPGLLLFQGLFGEILNVFHLFQAFSPSLAGVAKDNVDVADLSKDIEMGMPGHNSCPKASLTSPPLPLQQPAPTQKPSGQKTFLGQRDFKNLMSSKEVKNLCQLFPFRAFCFISKRHLYFKYMRIHGTQQGIPSLFGRHDTYSYILHCYFHQQTSLCILPLPYVLCITNNVPAVPTPAHHGHLKIVGGSHSQWAEEC